ncbi:hypothetical protein [Gilliamella apis]|uniref:hypothetical protein n=1 Tax=Gilliamella apis TaxID=1970738 RepID=UPI000A34DBDB|nr:hypothetical protein [Gilliamella apis]OTQ36742.1 hypothetical protein B6C84_01335 [Gilliamella apis]OTQ43509.1 hypothetical protein B6C94_02185 [Gilliamella apis]OTQ47447.1 hypothetical protein B6C86_02135 [Gilliamella apis]OTQ49775.1 hypothetical protein B6C92_08645 [Gilliamella apis]OTQ52683.1 hypothetical protein B6C96_02225 [Gilliamella apis]
MLLRLFLSWSIFLTLLPIISLFFSFNSQALTAYTTNVIHGNGPYLTFDGGQTRAIDLDELMKISFSDGTTLTPASNNSNSSHAILLPVAGQSFADIDMLVPTNVNAIPLSTLIGTPYNYWNDDDGDGDFTVTGKLYLSILDKFDRPVTRDDVPTICKAPYRVMLRTDDDIILSTRYGVPRSRRFTASTVSYYIKPQPTADICSARPLLEYNGERAGPFSMWDPGLGFLVQSSKPSSYGLNFPTTGADGLYFDLVLGSIDTQLTWEDVSPNGDIKATMTYLNSSDPSIVRVTLNGPVATPQQWRVDDPGWAGKKIIAPSLPQTFELVGKGKDSHNNDIMLKYGFVLKQWFVNRGNRTAPASRQGSWCLNLGLGLGYRLPRLRELTNASACSEIYCPSVVYPSNSYHYSRRIGAGFLAEWGNMQRYKDEAKQHYAYWSSEPVPTDKEGKNTSNSTSQFAATAVYGLITGLGTSAAVACVTGDEKKEDK